MDNKNLKGFFTITVTPFNADSLLDVQSIKTFTEHQISKGVHGMTILGIMGEVGKLTEKERNVVMETTIEQNRGRVPVVVGCSASSTIIATQYAKQAEAAGAAAVMIAPPQKISNETLLLKHYAKIAENISIPIVLQDEPVTTQVILSPEFIAKAGKEIDSIKYVKLEEAPTAMKITKVLDKNSDLKIFGGLGGVHFYEELCRGAVGTMTGFAFPEILGETYNLFAANKKEESRAFFYKYLPLIRFEAQLGMGGVAIRKETYKLRGAIADGTVRFPSAPIDAQTMEDLKEMVSFLGLKLK